MAVRKKMCYVRGCPTEDNEPGIRFFHFPRTEDRCIKWVEFCQNDKLNGRLPGESRRYCYICSRHFARGAFQTELLNKLNRNAYPTLLSPPPLPPSLSPTPPPCTPLPGTENFGHYSESNSSAPSQLSDVCVSKPKLPWKILAPGSSEEVDVPDDEKVFQIASALKVFRNTLPQHCDAVDIDVLLMVLSDWENLEDFKRKYYFNKAMKLYTILCKGKYSYCNSGHSFKLGGLQESEVTFKQEVYDTFEDDVRDEVQDSKKLLSECSTIPEEVTVVCVAFM
ncbi:uncharacterized protein [Anabrus simplex]|uniref:uncharacterized protein isoform X1 n=1 Tax=Anabrus simplex TaxID=316456 RepID=UPI0035A3AACC